MLKTVMFASAIALAAPAFAQDKPVPPQDTDTTAPAQDETPAAEPATEADTPTTAQDTPPAAPQGDPIPGAPVTAPTPPEAATPAPQTTPAQPPAQPDQTAAASAPAPADANAPVTGASQIAQVVDTEFPAYDKNADNALDKGEFGAWMVALKTASDPATKADDPATVQWISGAFASADTDQSATVTKAELTTYLSQNSGE
ncbi:EF-hand domain-containing protein [Sphingomonas sp.]|uniref:EF-hand domain-containing protein n=1 Tax=Sphingomonas sp. TaxID=28214 RepID=UPI002DD64495|nr:EF-hand domain-containing protein [Sphingomonas sp.]